MKKAWPYLVGFSVGIVLAFAGYRLQFTTPHSHPSAVVVSPTPCTMFSPKDGVGMCATDFQPVGKALCDQLKADLPRVDLRVQEQMVQDMLAKNGCE